MKVLLLDGYNLMHRARYGFAKGEFNVVYNFFRGLRPLVGLVNPDVVYFVLEGHPKHRVELYPEYKQNRRKGLTPEDIEKLEDFKRQREIIYDLLAHFPFQIVHHPDYECDDVIAHLATNVHADDDCVIISRDTDFTQLLEHNNVSVYDPVAKKFIEPVDYDYVAFKSLVGDTADNIKGVPRVGKKTAAKIVNDLDSYFAKKPEHKDVYERNYSLIKLADVPNESLVFDNSVKDFDYVRERFADMDFESMITDKAWSNYIKTFDRIYL